MGAPDIVLVAEVGGPDTPAYPVIVRGDCLQVKRARKHRCNPGGHRRYTVVSRVAYKVYGAGNRYVGSKANIKRERRINCIGDDDRAAAHGIAGGETEADQRRPCWRCCRPHHAYRVDLQLRAILGYEPGTPQAPYNIVARVGCVWDDKRAGNDALTGRQRHNSVVSLVVNEVVAALRTHPCT